MMDLDGGGIGGTEEIAEWEIYSAIVPNGAARAHGTHQSKSRLKKERQAAD